MPARPFFPLRVHSLIALALTTTAIACANHAQAQTGFYLGGSIGQSHYKEQSPLTAPLDGGHTGFKAYVGYQFNPSLSVELGQAELGTFRAGSNTLQASGGYLDLVALAPLAPQWSVLGRLGLYDNRTLRTVGERTTVETGKNLKLGSGLQYQLNANTALRGEWERYGNRVNGQTANVDLYSLGVVVSF